MPESNYFLDEIRARAIAEAAARGMTLAEQIDRLDRALEYRAKDFFNELRRLYGVLP